jgi:PPOX class probable F420-dependent enzyme
VSVRDATPEDATAIATIRVASWRAAYAGIVPEAILARMDVEENAGWIGRRIAAAGTPARPDLALHGGSDTLVIEAGGRVAAYVLTAPASDPDVAGLGEIEALYVAPGAQGRGLGRQLVAAAMERLGHQGFDAVVLWVLTANEPARGFYERLGFGLDGASRPLDFDGVPIEEIRYRRVIPKTSYHRPMQADLPPATDLGPAVRAFLDAPHVATIGTVGADGAPHQAVAWYRLEPDDRILLNSRTPRRWPADLYRDGRVSLAIVDGADGRRWVGLTGVVEATIEDLDQARDDICALAERYDDADPKTLAEFRTQPRVSFRIRVTAVHAELDGD